MIEALQKGDQQSLEKLLNDGDGKPLTEAIEFVKGLKSSGQWEAYLKKAAAIKTDRILYTGYLTHTELWPLFSSTDCAIFPSMVAEAGPLVFLEAMSSGAFPMGTYMAGIKAQIDRLEGLLSKEDLELMKLSPDSSRTVKDVIQNIPKVLETAEKNREPLRKITVEKSDWSRIAKLFQEILDK
jgi:glycosyltransferase involved in cell wall biosynthesis